MSLKVAVVVGNPKPASRTRKIAELLVEKLLDQGTYEAQVIDLADYTNEIFAWPSEVMGSLNAVVADSDLAIFASPTYKATYTGLLKSRFTRAPTSPTRWDRPSRCLPSWWNSGRQCPDGASTWL